MDVRCARCGIEYEFDDALISERGTMVRCTECGHQFRVHPSHVIPGEPDEWRVVTASGRTVVFRTLRELQQGISQGEIGRDATLLRGKLPPRPLGSIAELDPFFPTRAGVNRQQSTLTGVAPPATAPADGVRPASTTGRVAVARVGLTTVQVPANSPQAEVVRPLGGRKTAMGIGLPTATNPRVLAETTDKVDDATVPMAPPGAGDGQSEKRAESLTTTQPFEKPVAAPTEPAKPAELPSSEDKPAGRGKYPSEPPTLRDGEAPRPGAGAKKAPAKSPTSESKSAMKAAAMPPRPTRRTHPTPAAGTAAASATLHSEVAPAVAKPEAKPPRVVDKPQTDPPPAMRRITEETPAESPLSPPVAQPSKRDETKGSTLQSVALKPSADEEAAEDAINFQAESKPIDSPLSSPHHSLEEPPAVPAAFVPTLPPARLTSAEALKHNAEVRAKSSRAGRWLMVGLLGVLVTLAGVFAYHRQVPSSSGDKATKGASFEQQLQAARDALRAGDLSLAHENLQASQQNGVRDARWLTLTARYDIVRADMSWLAVKLADPADAARIDALKRELDENVSQSLKALKAVETLASKDPDLGPARIDAARLSGDLEKARAAAAALPASDPAPELAYSLASLELLQESPRFKEVFDWLGLARAQDSGLGRAPVMLVIACVAGNRLESARAEVQRLKQSNRVHPLLSEVEAFVQRASERAAPQEPPALPDAGLAAPAAAPADTGETEAASSVNLEGDFRLRLRRAVESLARNELTRSEQLFRSVLAERPKDTEALTGLGDVARRHGNTTNAISYYERVLANNGQYLPALSGLAAVKAKSGDRAGAIALYRRIVDQVGESPGYGQSAAQRLRELEGSGSKPSANPEQPEKPSGESPAADTPGKSQ